MTAATTTSTDTLATIAKLRKVDYLTPLDDEILTEIAVRSRRVRFASGECVFSELESGARVVALGAVPVLPELEAVAAELADRAARAGVALVVEGDPSIELPLRPRMLRVIAQNLAENAIRYAGPGSTFTLAVERVGDEIVVRGSDDGVGVSEAELGRLFERFFRADRARASRGTGLGLAIVKHIVTQSGGTVEARGSRGRGLEIRCTYPAI